VAENTQKENTPITSTDKKVKSRPYGVWIKLFWFVFIVGILGTALLFTAINYGLLGKLPSFEELEDPNILLASEIYSSDNKAIGKYYRQNRSSVSFSEIPENLKVGLLSTEDARFYEHSGIDGRALMRATLLLGKKGGGSTLTQQLAKLLFTNVDRSNFIKRLLQKLKEWVIAVKLERSYTKDEIMTMYLNKAEFSRSAFGLKSAAKIWFSKTPAELNIQESSLLVGMLKAPGNYDATKESKIETSRNRRNTVIDQIVKYSDFLSPEHADSIQNLPMVIQYSKEDHNVGLATYFRETLRLWLNDWCKENKKLDGTPYDIYRDGLKIFTTLDSRMQTIAENAVKEHMPEIQKSFNDSWKVYKTHPWEYNWKDSGPDTTFMKTSIKRTERYRVAKLKKKSWEEIIEEFETPVQMKVFSYDGPIDTLMSPKDSLIYTKYFLHAGFMAMEPGTGHVKAWVGGIDHQFFKYDHVKESSRNQIGSTFKPFIYSLAIQNGWSPCKKVPNMPVTFDKYDNYTPVNASEFKAGEILTLKQGLAFSMNQITAYLMKELNPLQSEDGYVDMLRFFKRMGIVHADEIMPVPSMCLGTADLSVFEMVGAYGTFANQGVWTKPIFITKIEDKHGNVIQEFATEQIEALDPHTSYAMLSLMSGVKEFGTARRLNWKYGLADVTVAGKTGTTQKNSDGWYMGITPKLIAGAWVGGDDRIIRFVDTGLGSGATMALPLFGLFMRNLYDNEELGYDEEAEFLEPPNFGIELDCNRYLDPVNPFEALGQTGEPGGPPATGGLPPKPGAGLVPASAGQPDENPNARSSGSITDDDFYGDEFE